MGCPERRQGKEGKVSDHIDLWGEGDTRLTQTGRKYSANKVLPTTGWAMMKSVRCG